MTTTKKPLTRGKPQKAPAPQKKTKSKSTRKLVRKVDQPIEAAALDDALLTVETVALVSGTSVSHVYREIASGRLAAVRKGARFTRIRGRDFKAYSAALAA